MRDLSHADVLDMFIYDSESGLLTRRKWTSNRTVGAPVGSPNKDGHLKTTIRGKSYLVHRVIWLMNYGEWPAGCVDHIDGDPANNRLSNLRIASKSENGRNRGISVLNTSGCTGVCWLSKLGRWQAQIKTDEGHKCLGQFETIFEAACSRKSAEITLGYHPNHGHRPSRNRSVMKECNA